MGMGVKEREKMAKRAAAEIKPGMVVNLGIGIPSLVPNFLPLHVSVMFQAENGLVGIGPSPKNGEEDVNLCNAGGLPITIVPGASYSDSTVSFAMIRRGRVDMTILGALQVSEKGDLANWIVPGKKVPGMGGAMELAQKAKKVIVLMNHTDKHGHAKIVRNCTLPLTSRGCVDLIITEMAVFQVEKDGLILSELAEGCTLEAIKRVTACPFSVKDNLKVIPRE
ncbi:3-oxoacid CoA-transferase subunit B [Bacillus benzoevorans]|uniref:Acetate CoA/acetoacetate CoA-transferase beta subunit n=1 Tax=Bacillus benzoevorans TaxID=1456 RepID=A0A7X0HRN8_9BACI|nr:3-oxoacid CoA-transferase subunit B [Bacillus benzoevorans]MBB6444572.1 acetate CoA/acetoacetate CoA-transferase beta subunit [Bacillus benzoevorans]